MDDDDDQCLLDILGEPPALNYFLHRSGSKLITDSKPSSKSLDNHLGEISSDELCLPTSLQFLEDELDSSSPLQELVEDQPFDILQKSLQEANITEQTLAEEAYLDASSGSSQQCAQASLHSSPSSVSSFTQGSNVSNYSGQSLQPVGVGHVPVVQQALDTSFGSSSVNVQQSFMQVGVNSVTTQQLSNSSQIGGSPGQIQLLGSVSTQPSMMTINHLDGSHIILKGNGQQRPANMSGGLLVQRQSPSGNSLYGGHNPNLLTQSVGSHFSNCNVAASLPVHNIIIQRSPNPAKVPINIQPKPNQVGHQAIYSTQGMQQHHVRHGVPYPQSNSQNSTLGHQMTVSIVNQQNMRKSAAPQSVNPSGSGIVIHSPMGQPHAPQNRFFLPTNLSVNSNSLHHVQTINGQILHNPRAHMMTGQAPSEHVIVNQNSTSMVMANQSYSGQILTTQNTAVQLVSGQAFTASGGQVLVNHGTSQTVAGQVQQISPTVLHLSPSQGSITHAKSGFATVHAGQPVSQVMPLQNQYAVMDTSSTACPNMGQTVQPVLSGASISGVQHSQQIQAQVTVSSTHCLPDSSLRITATYSQAATQQPFASPQVQKKLLNQPFSALTSDPQDGLKQPQLTSLLSNKMSPGHSNCQAGKVTGGTTLQHHFGKIQQHQEKQSKQGCFHTPTQADCPSSGQKRSASSQLTKGNLILKHLQKDHSHVVAPDKTPFTSLEDTFERLIPYNVFQGSLPTEEELKKVDDEFEVVATQMLKRSQAMLNKYRGLLLEEAVRVNPSAEMVMIDRMFNQEERTILSHDKRLALMDPDGYLADFCCLSKCLEKCNDKTQFMETASASALDVPDQKDCALTHSSGAVSAAIMKFGKNNGNVVSVGKTMQMDINENKLEDINRLLEAKKYNSHCSEEKVLDSCRGSLVSDGISPRSFKNGSNADRLPSKTTSVNPTSSCRNSCQGKIQNSSGNESVCLTAKESSESQEMASLNEHIESTFKSILELKNKQTELESKTPVSNNPDLQLPQFTAVASGGNCLEKFAADHKEGAAETDSVLEAAVNSILEC
ncbi:BRD4-interacting chromatin-remodeling complex-associated protein-like [Protopterus annectens]|uniref:BRD4-interacting chromatin-remodeling complex-associated protein-like n=1 Tax=Protopterus annectens TaxID=7888 RepID=UPI001CF9A59B|nr:BRD4-interacting chromatin-remodeling complex-associated protein-like [Protopterus annectens]